ncbi:3-ketoacyl-ACP reductase FabG2 [Serratia rubidaea]|uniref:3-ketoacyl-ACP reductase FabG2 n=1 Tax=Serratia rubidaea TaxID=61652 RepID=UPI00177F0E06|nr:3-ketoacyl-ACP reductase FabG2 [Serratia rubidaea]MBD8450727.1 3-oxoacyl-ACP reductase FabG [Serratia rubidaea]UJD78950.1 3-oxoacyl-ACP reductase FabG [Serratia rubidaea]UJD83503.1 3-oxoacyl-ACP reductase FabG [Serratia rubidaea]
MTRSVLVTGASKGIGQAIACRLAADGFYMVVHYHRDRAGAEQTLQQITAAGGQGRLIQFDISDRVQCRERLEQDIERHGAYYGVVNNAGITRDGAFPALSDGDWDGVIHTNLDSFYNVLHPCVMPMIGLRKGGRIIALSSVSGVMGNRGQVNYSAAKAGVIGACKALAVELAKRKITVNCIAPGLIDTGMVDMEPLARDEAMRAIPLKRMGTAEEVAGLASYLMSDIAGYVTRQVVSINGGMV